MAEGAADPPNENHLPDEAGAGAGALGAIACVDARTLALFCLGDSYSESDEISLIS